MKRKLILGLVFCVVLSSYITHAYQEFQYPDHFPEPLYNFEANPFDAMKVEIGRVLFYDPMLSKNGKISCASCHSPYNSFAHTDHDLSHGINDSIGTRNAPALINLAWQRTFMRDGAIRHLDMQSLAPIEHPAEMGEQFDEVLKKIQRSEMYQGLFAAAYKNGEITGERILKAFSQFQLSLISANSKYDRIQMGLDSFSVQEEKGYQVFLQHCNACHQEPLFNSNEFVYNGLAIDSILMDFGRMSVTKNRRDSLKFKVPTLRNLTYSYPYMHDGRFDKLSQVIGHYRTKLAGQQNLDPRLQKLSVISKNEGVDLIAFLLILGDPSFVFDTKHQYSKEILRPR